MAREIERKFLVRNDSWKTGNDGVFCCQAYLAADERVTVRARILGDSGYLTVKGRSEGAARDEFEYPIPVEDARAMIERLSSGGMVEKIRYSVEAHGMRWDVDEFLGANGGLVLAEVELDYEGQEFVVPEWAGEEVTGDVRYYNSRLAAHPFSQWDRKPGTSPENGR
ncbi:MAG: CYTH domain-containing protein [Geobacteraceae bacterium]|nr:CYTH domain-containing protein [Geobacteraceae bacterium]